MKQFDCYVACDNGILKGIGVSTSSCVNLASPDSVRSGVKDEITDMSWIGTGSILISRNSQEISVFDLASSSHTRILSLADVGDRINAVDACDSQSFAVSWCDGTVRGYSSDGQLEKFQLNAGSNLSKMRWPSGPRLVTGGRDNPLKVWDPTSGKDGKPIFSAKNLKNDWLELKRGVWEADFALFPDQRSLASVTSYCEARLYDLKSGQRRPVLEYKFGEYPFTSVCLTDSQYEIIAGTADGRLAMFDMRAKGGLLRVFKGFAGTVKSVKAHPRQPVVVSGGLDRFVLVHDKDSGKIEQKIYAKSRINCILLNNNDSHGDLKISDANESATGANAVGIIGGRNGGRMNGDADALADLADDDETVWNELKPVIDKPSVKSRKRRQISDNTNEKHAKCSSLNHVTDGKPAVNGDSLDLNGAESKIANQQPANGDDSDSNVNESDDDVEEEDGRNDDSINDDDSDDDDDSNDDNSCNDDDDDDDDDDGQ